MSLFLNFSPWQLLTALLLAALLVAVPGGYVLMFIPWVVVVAIACKREHARHRGLATLATYVLVTAAVVVAAILAPVKTKAYVLERQLVLPKTELTFAELERDICRGFVRLSVPEDDAVQIIRFRATDITLREFVATVENQSKLRHRFGHCGNGSSILFGGDCSFGLHLREPQPIP